MAPSLDDWTAFYALMGGVAATLLGLLFVALSLRLNIFRQREVADVRDFAAFAFGTFLVAIAIPGLALAPHEEHGTLALLLFAVGLLGVFGMVWVSRIWLAMNHLPDAGAERDLPNPLKGWGFIAFMGCAYLGLGAAAVLLWRGHPAALGWLAIVEVWMLASGTVAAWILLSHAGAGQER